MRPRRHLANEVGDDPIRVLLIGERWDEVAQVIQALSGEGSFHFTRPLRKSDLTGIEDWQNRLSPLVVTLGPGVASYDADFVLRQGKDREDPPPLLVCVADDELENEELYKHADDLLVVPCSSAEMGIRLKRLAFGREKLAPSSLLTVGDITLDPATYQVLVDGRRVDLAWLEFQLLKFLMENTGRVFSRDQLLARVWGVESFGGTRTVDVHIRRLRNKMETRGQTYFRTVKNVGYGMVEPL